MCLRFEQQYEYKDQVIYELKYKLINVSTNKIRQDNKALVHNEEYVD